MGIKVVVTDCSWGSIDVLIIDKALANALYSRALQSA
jgi:hypothetical protein